MTEQPVTHDGVRQQTASNGTPWSFAATLGFAVLAIVGYALAQLATLSYIMPDFAKMDQKVLEGNGDLLSFTTISSTIVICLLIVLFTWMRKGYPTRTYLGLFWPSWREFFFWLAVLIGSSLLILGLYYMMGLPMTSQTMINLYKSTNYAMLFWVTVVVAAPLSEEFFFRGFLLDGWRNSFLGVYGAVILTALFWGVIHVQYQWHMIAAIVVMGIIFGLARVRTGSLLLVMALHAINNFISMLEMHFFYMG